MTMQHVVFLDLETLPGPERPDPETLTPPGNYKSPDAISKWRAENADKLYRAQALDSMLGRILTIGFAVDDQDPVAMTLGLEAENEADLLRQFENAIIEECGSAPPTWVAFNGYSFDMPWIWRKAIKHGLNYLPRKINFDRYKGNIVDPMRMWHPHDYRGFVKLGDLAAFLGLGTKTDGFDGSMIFDAWQEGRLEEIADYCREDVALVREVFRKLEPWT